MSDSFIKSLGNAFATGIIVILGTGNVAFAAFAAGGVLLKDKIARNRRKDPVSSDPRVDSQPHRPTNALYLIGTKRLVGHRIWENFNGIYYRYANYISEDACSGITGLFMDGEWVPKDDQDGTNTAPGARWYVEPFVHEDFDDSRTRIFVIRQKAEGNSPTRNIARIFECFMAEGNQGTFRQKWTEHLDPGDPFKVTSTDRLEGMSYYCVELIDKGLVYTTIPRLEVLVDGILTRRPTTRTNTDISTWPDNVFNANPYSGVEYMFRKRFGITPNRMHLQSLVDAYYYSHEDITRSYVTDEQVMQGYIRTTKRHELHGYFSSATPLDEFIDAVNEVTRGKMPIHSKLIHFMPGRNPTGRDLPTDPNTTALTLTEDDLLEGTFPITNLNPGLAGNSNSRTAQLIQSSANEYASEARQRITDPFQLAQDQGIHREADNLPQQYLYSNDPISVDQLTTTGLRQLRELRKYKSIELLPGENNQFLRAKPGDIVNASFLAEGEGENAWIIRSATLNYNATLVWVLTLFYPDTYDDITTFTPIPELTITAPPLPATPTGLALAFTRTVNEDNSITYRVNVTWDESDFYTRVFWRETPDNPNDTTVPYTARPFVEETSDSFIVPSPGRYQVYIRHENTDGVASENALTREVNVTGLVPTSPDSVTIDSDRPNIFYVEVDIPATAMNVHTASIAVVNNDITDDQLALIMLDDVPTTTGVFVVGPRRAFAGRVRSFFVYYSQLDGDRDLERRVIAWTTNQSGENSTDYPFAPDA